MKTVRMKIDVLSPGAKPVGRVDVRKVDATTEADITRHQSEDDADAMQDAAKFARRVRRRLGFSQAEFAHRIDVSLDTIRNWEQYRSIAPKTKRIAVSMMTLSIGVSIYVVREHLWLQLMLATIAVSVGTWMWRLPEHSDPEITSSSTPGDASR